jgi:hypothetical protein
MLLVVVHVFVIMIATIGQTLSHGRVAYCLRVFVPAFLSDRIPACNTEQKDGRPRRQPHTTLAVTATVGRRQPHTTLAVTATAGRR